MADSLREYRAEARLHARPPSRAATTSRRKAGGNRYLIQKHAATRLHFDFRLELDGVLLSLGGPERARASNPNDKRLAVRTEDHPLDYGDFEGTIPKGEYGGGTVMLWDEGTWEPVGDPEAALAKGDFKFILHGERLKGNWVLVRMRKKPGERSKHENWLLIKERDEYATEETKPIVERVTNSVRTGRTMDEIAAGNVEWLKSGASIKKGDRGAGEEEGRRDGRPKACRRRNSSSRSSRRWSMRRPKATNGSTRSSMTATARSPRSAAARSASTPATASTGPTSSSRLSGRSPTCRCRRR